MRVKSARPTMWKACSQSLWDGHTPRMSRFSKIQWGSRDSDPSTVSKRITAGPSAAARTVIGCAAVPAVSQWRVWLTS